MMYLSWTERVSTTMEKEEGKKKEGYGTLIRLDMERRWGYGKS